MALKYKRMSLILLASVLVGACTARQRYPDPAPGWHSSDYSVVFGRLFRIPAPVANPDNPVPPAWVLKFGESKDAYNGEVALTPAERFVGYSGGEPVEVRGHLLNQATTDQYNGRWYVVDSIRMWEGHR